MQFYNSNFAVQLNRSAYKVTVTLQCGSRGALTKLRGRKDRHLFICVVYTVVVTLQCGSVGALTQLRGRKDRHMIIFEV